MSFPEKIRRKQNKKKHKKTVCSLLFLAPSFIGVLLFIFLIPILVMIVYYSMIDNPVRKNFVLFDNFIALLSNNGFRWLQQIY